MGDRAIRNAAPGRCHRGYSGQIAQRAATCFTAPFHEHDLELRPEARFLDVAYRRNGKLLAYILEGSEKHGLRVRDTSGSKERRATVDRRKVSGVMISPDDAYLYYRRKGNDGIGNCSFSGEGRSSPGV